MPAPGEQTKKRPAPGLAPAFPAELDDVTVTVAGYVFTYSPAPPIGRRRGARR